MILMYGIYARYTRDWQREHPVIQSEKCFRAAGINDTTGSDSVTAAHNRLSDVFYYKTDTSTLRLSLITGAPRPVGCCLSGPVAGLMFSGAARVSVGGSALSSARTEAIDYANEVVRLSYPGTLEQGLANVGVQTKKDFGYIVGGRISLASQTAFVSRKVDLPCETVSLLSGLVLTLTISDYIMYPLSVTSDLYSYVSGGNHAEFFNQNTGDRHTTDRISWSTDTASMVAGGDLIGGRQRGGSFSSAEKGYFAGTDMQDPVCDLTSVRCMDYTDTSEFITFATETASIGPTLPWRTGRSSGMSAESHRGLLNGGAQSATDVEGRESTYNTRELAYATDTWRLLPEGRLAFGGREGLSTVGHSIFN